MWVSIDDVLGGWNAYETFWWILQEDEKIDPLRDYRFHHILTNSHQNTMIS